MTRTSMAEGEAQGRASLDRAAELAAAGRSDEAKELIRGLCHREWAQKAHPVAVARAVRLCADLGMLKRALRLAETRLGAPPEAPELRYLAARLSVRRALDRKADRVQRLRAAEAHLRALLTERPAEARAHALLGLVLDHLGRVQESIEAWKCAHVLEPADLEHRTGLAAALCASGRYREAIPHFEGVARDSGERAEPLVNLGLALREAGELEAAIETFLRAATLKPRSARIQVEIGLALRGLSRLEAALEAFDRAIRLAPEDAEAYHQRGRALLRVGRRDEAAQAIEAARQRAPFDRTIQRTVLDLARTPASEDEETVAVLQPIVPDLTADLARFPVPELVEFLGMSRRTGMLEVGNAHLELVEGRLLSGQGRDQPGFLERLVGEGARIPPSVAEVEYGRGAGPLLEALLDEDALDRDAVERLCFETTVEALLTLLDVDEGRAEFRSRPLGAPGLDARLVELAVDAQGVLLEAFRRVDEGLAAPLPKELKRPER